MNRIIIHTSEPSSGAARYVCELVRGLRANGAAVTLFGPPTYELRGDVEASGAEFVPGGHRGTDDASLAARIARNLGYLISTALRQVRLMKAGDVVHFQFPLYFPGGLVFFGLARLQRCRIVFTAHDPKPHKWLLPARLRRLEWNMVRWAYAISDRLIVHNETGKQVLIREFGQAAEKIDVVAHGPLRAAQESGAPSAGGLRLLVFGSIRENKNAHLAIAAVQSLREKIQLTIAGEVANARERDYWENCKAAIARQPEGIEAIERYIPDEEVGRLVAEHHALLLPYSNFTSESGVAALAMANGRAMIATRAGGLGELLEQCACGIAIEGPSMEQVRDAIAEAMRRGPDALLRMGAAGAAWVESERSWTEIGERTLAVYAAAEQDRPARRPLDWMTGGVNQ